MHGRAGSPRSPPELFSSPVARSCRSLRASPELASAHPRRRLLQGLRLCKSSVMQPLRRAKRCGSLRRGNDLVAVAAYTMCRSQQPTCLSVMQRSESFARRSGCTSERAERKALHGGGNALNASSAAEPAASTHELSSTPVQNARTLQRVAPRGCPSGEGVPSPVQGRQSGTTARSCNCQGVHYERGELIGSRLTTVVARARPSARCVSRYRCSCERSGSSPLAGRLRR